MVKGSIVRIINTKAKNRDENRRIKEKHLKYILRKEATDKNLMWSNMVDEDDILGSFGFFAQCAGKNNGRPLKHIVLSYATDSENKILDWATYLEITKNIASFYGKDYQMIAAVHKNIKKRPHAHIILDCFNVSSEKKYSEGIHELENFKDFIDEVLEKYGVPKLLRWKNKKLYQKNANISSKVSEKRNFNNYGNIVVLDEYCLSVINNDIDVLVKSWDKFAATDNDINMKNIYDFFMNDPKKNDVIYDLTNLREE